MTTDRLPARASAAVLGVARGGALGFVALALVALALVALALVPLLGLGVPMLAELLPLVRRVASVQRRWAAHVLGVELPDPTPTPAVGTVGGRAGARLRDRMVWQELAWTVWQAVAGPVAALVVALPVVIGVAAVLAPDAAWLSAVLVFVATPFVVLAGLVALPLQRAQAVVARLLLAEPEARAAAVARIDELTRTRARTVEAQSAELRRIERDLHDGVQARLVALGLTVGIARAELGRAPQRADELLVDAAEAVTTTLDELRALIRGIHPPVLAERGLPAALEALALGAAVPVRTRVEAVDGLPDPVASACYFAAAEALTNVSRHAGAARAELDLHRGEGGLRLVVADDGRGGADDTRGSGLRGIRDRVAALDGRLDVSSPPGGPTTIRLEVPCAP